MLRVPHLDSGRPERLAVLALAVLGLLTFANSLSSQFVLDDIQYINGRVLDHRSWDWLTPKIDLPIKGRPLVGLSLVANYALGGDRPAGYHLFNMVVHIICATVLFGTVRRALAQWNTWNNRSEHSTGFAFACASLWMVHPLQTECVNYVSQRTESMASLFILTSLYCAIRSHGDSNRTRWMVAAGMASWAGAFCKETAAIGPILILLFDCTFARRTIWDLIRNRWPLYVAVFSSWLPIASLLYLAPRTETVGMDDKVTVLGYALSQGVVLVEYLQLVVWPEQLVIDYGPHLNVTWIETSMACFAIVSLLTLTIVAYRRYPVCSYLGLAAFLLLAPTSSFVPINTEVGAERRMYLPLAAIVVLLVLGVRQVVRRVFAAVRSWQGLEATGELGRARWRVPASFVYGLLLSAALLALGLRTVDRNADYTNPLKLWRQAVEAHPENSRAWTWLAYEFYAIDPATAERVTAETAARWHDDWWVLYPVGEAFLSLHGNEMEALRCFRRVIELEPRHANARLRLVWLLAACSEERMRNGVEALELAKQLTTEYPSEPEMLDALAMAQAECGDFASAMATIEKAIGFAEAADGATALLKFRLNEYRRGKPFRFGGGRDSRS